VTHKDAHVGVCQLSIDDELGKTEDAREAAMAQIVFTNLLVHDFCLSLTERNALVMRKNHVNTQQHVVTKLEALVSSQDELLNKAAEALRDPIRCVAGESPPSPLPWSPICWPCATRRLRRARWTLAAMGRDLMADASEGVTTAFATQLSTVVVNTQRLELIVSDLLDRSSMADGKKLLLKTQPIALWPVVQSIVRLFSSMAMPAVRVQVDVPSSLPAVHADEHRVAQVLGNLLSNAFKATHHGAVAVRAQKKGDFLEVSVEDSGPGMSKTAMRNFFTPPAAKEKEEHEFGGMGLGLSLSLDLVQAHGVRPTHRAPSHTRGTAAHLFSFSRQSIRRRLCATDLRSTRVSRERST